MATNFTTVPLTYSAVPNTEKADSLELATAWGNNAAPVFNSDGAASDSSFLKADAASKRVVKGFPYELSFKHGLSTLGKTLLIPS